MTGSQNQGSDQCEMRSHSTWRQLTRSQKLLTHGWLEVKSHGKKGEGMQERTQNKYVPKSTSAGTDEQEQPRPTKKVQWTFNLKFLVDRYHCCTKSTILTQNYTYQHPSVSLFLHFYICHSASTPSQVPHSFKFLSVSGEFALHNISESHSTCWSHSMI